MASATHSVLNTSENIHRVKDKYGQYSDKISRSKRLVDEIQKAERWEEQKLQWSFNALLFTSFYLLAKRFFLWEFLFAVYYVGCILVSYGWHSVVLPLVTGVG